jgi:zinc protease
VAKTNKSQYLTFLFLLFISVSCTLFAGNASVFTLENGLNVFIKEAKAAPVVSINIWIKVGSVNEEAGQEGYSHLIEHMMFKGTKNFPYGVLDNEIKQMGAKQNAFTANDYTCFYLVGASRFFERLFELQADAVLNSVFDEEELRKEIEVVIEELRMTLDNPGSRIVQLLMAEAFEIHPYKHPIVGYIENLQSITREKLFSFYKRFYVPSNMWVVVVGDVDCENALEVVKKYMGNAPKIPKPAQRIPVEPEQNEMRLKVEHGDIQHSYIRMGWKAPGMGSKDRFALHLMARIAGGGASAWLWKELVEKEQIAISAGAGYFSSQFPMLFQVGALTTPGKARIFTERAKEIIYRFKNAEVTEDELNKAKQQIVANDIYGKETAENYAAQVGHYALLGDVWDVDRFVDQIRNITVKDLQKVAKKYFKDTGLTIARYEPEPVSPDSKPEMVTLDNGLKLILKENHSSPIIAVDVKIGAGGLREGKKQAGLANMTTEMMFKGANGLTAQEIAEKFESMGSRYGSKASKSYTSFNFRSLTENFIPTLELFLDILHKPDFDSDEFEKMQDQVADWIKNEEDDLFEYTRNNALEALFPETPIGYSTYGKLDELKRLKRNDLVNFHKKYFVANNMVVAIVGDFYAAEIKEELLKQFGRFEKGKVSDYDLPKLKKINEPIEISLQKNREQAQIIYAARTFPANDDKVLAMAVVQNILSGSMSSRLFKNLRAKDSLAYSTWAYNVGMANTGYFMTTISTAATKVGTATRRLKEEIDDFRENGFSDKEFEDAKKYMIGQHALSMVDNLSLAKTYASDEFFDKGFDYSIKYPELIASVTRQQVEEVATEYLLASGSYVITVTKP